MMGHEEEVLDPLDDEKFRDWIEWRFAMRPVSDMVEDTDFVRRLTNDIAAEGKITQPNHSSWKHREKPGGVRAIWEEYRALRKITREAWEKGQEHESHL